MFVKFINKLYSVLSLFSFRGKELLRFLTGITWRGMGTSHMIVFMNCI